jgi:crotonobetainyl-CoA:carnitine CoA-transferase CaiB-like acyl-CoA transferase
MLFTDKPLVLDLTRLLPGPYGTFLMAHFGMEVVKIEDRGAGDYMKTLCRVEGETEDALIYRLLNGNKRIIYLDLKDPVDREQFLELVKTARVVAESFRPGVMERLGLGYETLKAINPGLVFINIGGYLDKSPKAARAGHDLNYLAESGIIGNTGKNSPEMLGIPVSDLTGGLAMFGLVAGALYRQQQTGTGMYLKVGIDELMVSWGNIGGSFFGKPHQYPPPGGSMITGGIVNYHIYRARDGYVALAALEEKFWDNFITAINRPDLRGGHMTPATLDNQYYTEIAAYFDARSRQEIIGLMEGADCCISPILSLAEAVPTDEATQLHNFTDFLEYQI